MRVLLRPGHAHLRMIASISLQGHIQETWISLISSRVRRSRLLRQRGSLSCRLQLWVLHYECGDDVVVPEWKLFGLWVRERDGLCLWHCDGPDYQQHGRYFHLYLIHRYPIILFRTLHGCSIALFHSWFKQYHYWFRWQAGKLVRCVIFIILILHSLISRHHKNCIASLSGHTSWVLSVDCDPMGATFATGSVYSPFTMYHLTWFRSSDRKVKVWDWGQRQCMHTFDDHNDQVWSVSYNGSGKRIVSGSDDGALAIYGL